MEHSNLIKIVFLSLMVAPIVGCARSDAVLPILYHTDHDLMGELSDLTESLEDPNLKDAFTIMSEIMISSKMETISTYQLFTIPVYNRLAEGSQEPAPDQNVIGVVTSPKTGFIIGAPAILREYPRTDAEEIARLMLNEKVGVMVIHGDWYGIVREDRRQDTCSKIS